MGLFTVPATLSNPIDPERRLVLDLIVDTGAVYTRLPATVVQELGLEGQRSLSAPSWALRCIDHWTFPPRWARGSLRA